MKLIPFERQHVPLLMNWFLNQDQVMQWGGPSFRFPYTEELFTEDLNLSELTSIGLFENQQLIAFGQFYERLNRCHLGRLAVAPSWRNRGIGKQLVEQICGLSQRALKLNSWSLFVLSENDVALKLYRHCGFQVQPYPEPLNLANCLYMVKKEESPDNAGLRN